MMVFHSVGILKKFPKDVAKGVIIILVTELELSRWQKDCFSGRVNLKEKRIVR